jgi:ribose transport system ATP-binding protein/inositol transport system ATP-binding protein
LEKPAGKNHYIFECNGIAKTFGGIRALDNVDLKIKKGDVHALVGENGAGKSTLMKIIIGLYRRDSGQMFFNSVPYETSGPAESAFFGISMIHQELNIEPHLTIAENIFLHREDSMGIFLIKKKTNEKTKQLLKRFKISHSYKTPMSDLTIAQSQMIEVIRAVSCNASLIIMDEPTSSLDSEETKKLFQTIKELQNEGVSIIYISHRMEEIFDICNTVSVFRDGRHIVTKPVRETDRDELISFMVGREIKNLYPVVNKTLGDITFEIRNFSGKGFKNINIKVRKGEIVGLSGLVGSGRSETMRAVFGLDLFESGELYLDGKKIKVKSPRQAIKNSLAMVTEDRKAYGLCLFRSIRENISLPNLRKKQRGVFINQKREKHEVSVISQRLSLKMASLESEAYSLSGGNQQKVVISKWIMAMPKVLIMDEPTRGIDVGAKSEIHKLIGEFASQGMAVIMVSSELPEVMGMSDRILVYHEGEINGEILKEDIESGKITQKEILTLEFGTNREETINAKQ